MATTNPITNQKYLNVSFALSVGDEAFSFFTFPIKPEELTRAEPSRVSVVNTLGGAWVDSFGRGLATITITGNTGWRDRTGQGDGIAQFSRLRDEFIHYWHELRELKINAGLDPSDIRLIFIDPLNGSYVADVVPTNFSLRRSKSQPLLLMYNIAMTAVNDKAVNPYPYLMDPVLPENDPEEAVKSMNKSISDISALQTNLRSALSNIGGFSKSVQDWTDATFLPVMKVAQDVIQTANDAKAVISAAGQVAVDLAANLSNVGSKMWDAVASVASLPSSVMSEVMRVKGAMTNLHCVLVNGYKTAYSAQDYGSWYGASNCSSTLGGSSISAMAGVNPFDTNKSAQLVSQSAVAKAATADQINALSDPTATLDLTLLNRNCLLMMA